MPLTTLARRATLPALALALAACVPVVVPIPLGTTSMAETPRVKLATASRPETRRAKLGAAPASARCTPPSRARAARGAVLAAVNRERRARGLTPLAPDARLTAAAQGQACDNAARGIYSHIGSDGSDLGVRVKREGFPLRLAAENTARGFDSTERLIAFWMGSPDHRKNILNPGMRALGLGLAQPPGDRPNWVLVLGRPG